MLSSDAATYWHVRRPADQGELDDDAELADLPAQMPSAPGAAGHPYFVVVSPEAPPLLAQGMYTPVQVHAALTQPLLSWD